MDRHPEYQRNPSLPAAEGWCEAIIIQRPPEEPGERYCYTKARFERDGRRICGLHREPFHVNFGPPATKENP